MTASSNINSKDKDTSSSSSGASKTTSFSPVASKKMIVPIAATFVLAVMGAPVHVAALAFFFMFSKMLKSGKGETQIQFWAKFMVLQLFYCGFLLGFAFLVLLPLTGPKLTGYHALALYLPIYTISLHDRRDQYGWFGTFVVQTFFDIPLVTAGYVCREFFGLRLLAPFADILDDNIVQGSMPFPSDIATLAAEPYNVGLIVNMCREYSGAKTEMKECGVVQCHLPHQDTTPPSYESLVKGCAHIEQFKKHNPTKRVYIHCKSGIARASTMSLAHYVRNVNQDPDIAIRKIKTKRSVVFEGVTEYDGIIRLNEERLLKQKQPQ